MGAPAARAARIEGFAEADVTRLLGDEAFRQIVDAYRGLYELPHGEALLHLLKISMGVIQEAVIEGRNAHVAAWVMWMAERGLDPAMSLAQQVVRAVERSGTARLLTSGQAPPRPARPSPTSPLPTLGQRVRRGLGRTAARLREAVLGEIAAEAAAARAEPKIGPSATETAKAGRQSRRSSTGASVRRASPVPVAPSPVKPRHAAQPARASP
jgi:hypothetical protein